MTENAKLRMLLAEVADTGEQLLSTLDEEGIQLLHAAVLRNLLTRIDAALERPPEGL